MLSFGKEFTFHLTIATFNDYVEEAPWKNLREKEKIMVTTISPFLTMFSTLSRREIIILAIFSNIWLVVCKMIRIWLSPKNCRLVNGKDIHHASF